MELPELMAETAETLEMPVERLNELLDSHLDADDEEVHFDDRVREEAFTALVKRVRESVSSLVVSETAVKLLLAIDDEAGTPVQLRRRLWEEHVGSREFDSAMRESFDKGIVTSNYLGPQYELTSFGRRFMPALYERLGIVKLT